MIRYHLELHPNQANICLSLFIQHSRHRQSHGENCEISPVSLLDQLGAGQLSIYTRGVCRETSDHLLYKFTFSDGIPVTRLEISYVVIWKQI